MAFDRILVGYVEGERGADAVALGADLARMTGATLMLASVVPAVWIEHFGQRSGTAVVHGGARERTATALEAAAAGVAGGLAHVERRLEASSSSARGLHDLAEAEGAGLVVLGSSHRGALGRSTVGTIADKLLHGAPCAVAVAPAGYATSEHGAIGVVGAAYDGSPEARAALRTGHALAAAAGATLRILTVLDPMPEVLERWVPLPGLEAQELVERVDARERQTQTATNALESAAAELSDDVPIQTEVLEGDDAARRLLDAAADIGLMVAGSRGYGSVHGTLAGSVSVALVREAPLPVLIVPRGVPAVT